MKKELNFSTTFINIQGHKINFHSPDLFSLYKNRQKNENNYNVKDEQAERKINIKRFDPWNKTGKKVLKDILINNQSFENNDFIKNKKTINIASNSFTVAKSFPVLHLSHSIFNNIKTINSAKWRDFKMMNFNTIHKDNFISKTRNFNRIFPKIYDKTILNSNFENYKSSFKILFKPLMKSSFRMRNKINNFRRTKANNILLNKSSLNNLLTKEFVYPCLKEKIYNIRLEEK